MMKLDQQQQAQTLYFQTDLSKTQIAEHIGVSRRSLHYWIKQNQWDRIKQNAEHIPSVLAENCYQLIGGLTAEILSPERAGKPVTPQEASAIYKLTLTIGKLKNRGTINENMELFGFFLDTMAGKDPELARKVAPHISSYIHERTANAYNHYHHAIQAAPAAARKQSAAEDQLDLLDELTWLQQQQPQPAPQPATRPQATPAPQPLPRQTQSPASPGAAAPASSARPAVRPPARFVSPADPSVPGQLSDNAPRTATSASQPQAGPSALSNPQPIAA